MRAGSHAGPLPRRAAARRPGRTAAQPAPGGRQCMRAHGGGPHVSAGRGAVRPAADRVHPKPDGGGDSGAATAARGHGAAPPAGQAAQPQQRRAQGQLVPHALPPGAGHAAHPPAPGRGLPPGRARHEGRARSHLAGYASARGPVHAAAGAVHPLRNVRGAGTGGAGAAAAAPPGPLQQHKRAMGRRRCDGHPAGPATPGAPHLPVCL